MLPVMDVLGEPLQELVRVRRLTCFFEESGDVEPFSNQVFLAVFDVPADDLGIHFGVKLYPPSFGPELDEGMRLLRGAGKDFRTDR